jgi:hypothetical protein
MDCAEPLTLLQFDGRRFSDVTLSADLPIVGKSHGHYLNVRPVGTTSDRSAIGARVVLHAGGRAQHRLVSGGSRFGCLPFEPHSGLGTETPAVDALDIWWPSGARQRVPGPIAAPTTVSITDGGRRVNEVHALARRRASSAIGRGWYA